MSRSGVVEGHAAKVLVHEARGALLLLVVGSRGHSGFEGLLLGSAGAQGAAHSSCRVVIVGPDHLLQAG
jgi:nucleotide-binding universal stress UspA family protein